MIFTCMKVGLRENEFKDLGKLRRKDKGIDCFAKNCVLLADCNVKLSDKFQTLLHE